MLIQDKKWFSEMFNIEREWWVVNIANLFYAAIDFTLQLIFFSYIKSINIYFSPVLTGLQCLMQKSIKRPI